MKAQAFALSIGLIVLMLAQTLGSVQASPLPPAPEATPGPTVVDDAEQDSSPESITLVLKAPAYQLQPLEGGLTAIEAEGCGLTGRPGQPLLPYQTIDVTLPPDVAWESLTLSVRDVQMADVPGTYKLRLAEPYRLCSGRAPDSEPALATEALPIARIAATGQMRKWHVARVDFVPFQYDPDTGQLRVVKQATVELRFARSGEEVSAALLADSVLDDVAAEQFVNYAAARAWYPAPARTAQGVNNILYDYVIITTNQLKSTQLSSFIAHKESQGHNVWLVTESDYSSLTGQAPDGRAEKVRQWLKNNYLTYGIKYVLLIGNPTPDGTGTTALPMKWCWPRYDEPDTRDAPTDYFFADLTGNWNMDGDLYYGEYHDDFLDEYGNPVPGGVDLFPEVYVGRIPYYGSDSDLAHILQKTIDYENATSIAWRKSALLPMSFIAADFDTAHLAERMWDDFLNEAGCSRYRIYQQGHGPCLANSSYPSEQELFGGTGLVRDRWAAHDYGIVAWWGHGNSCGAYVGWGDPAPAGCGDGVLFDCTQTGALDDAHPAFTFQSSCSTGWPEDSNNLQYAILKQGGIATVAATRGSFSGPATYAEVPHSDGNGGIGYAYLKRVVNGYTAGEALYQAKWTSAAHIIPYPSGSGGLTNFYDFNLYGDPDVRITDTAAKNKSYLSIPAAAFQPAVDGYDYENHGRFLKHFGTGGGTYVAPVHLPHGAIVTAVTYHWYDISTTKDEPATLYRTRRAGAAELMASALTFDEGGHGSSRDTTINYATIDNLNNAYWLQWDLSADGVVQGCSVVIEYIPPPAASQGYLSIPAAAFRPYEDGYDYDNAGVWLLHYHGPGGSTARGWYPAPVQLPQGAEVTKMTFYFYDDFATDNILARLQRSDLEGNYIEMAYVDSSGASSGYASKSDATINAPVIDNSAHSYWVILDGPAYQGPGHDASGVGVLIEYRTPSAPSGHLSLSSAAFTPFADDWLYQNHSRYLIHQGPADPSRAHYEAPVYLPQGAKVKKVAFWFNDDSMAANGYAHLCRTDQASYYSDMAYVDSYYAGGYYRRSDGTIDDAVIDNSRYAYWVYWDLPVSTGTGNNVWGTGVTLDYVVSTVYLPLVVRNW